MHCSTFSHQAAVQRYNLDPLGNKAAASNEFLNGFCAVLQGFSARVKLKKGPSDGVNDDWVDSNLVYQEYIKDRHHVHLSATRWNSVAGFVRFLGQKGIAEVKRKRADSSEDSEAKYAFGEGDEGSEASEEEENSENELVYEKDPSKRPKWFIKLIDKSPEAILTAKSKLAALKKTNEEELLRSRQLAAVEKKAKAKAKDIFSEPKVSHVIIKQNHPQTQPLKKAAAIFDESSSSDSDQNFSNLDYLKPKKLSILDDLAVEVISNRKEEPRAISFYPEKSIEINLDEDEEEIPWIKKGLVVRIGNASLAEGKYFGLLAVIEEVIDNFGAQVSVLKNGDVVLLDQDDCQPVSKVKDEDYDEQLSAVDSRLMRSALKTDRCVLLCKGYEGKEGRVLGFVNNKQAFEVELLAPGSSKIHKKLFELAEGQFCIYWE